MRLKNIRVGHGRDNGGCNQLRFLGRTEAASLSAGAGIHKQSSIKWDPNHGLKHSTDRGLAHTFIVKMTPFAIQSTSTAVFFFFFRRGLAFLGESSNLFQAALLLKLWKSRAGISKGKKKTPQRIKTICWVIPHCLWTFYAAFELARLVSWNVAVRTEVWKH